MALALEAIVGDHRVRRRRNECLGRKNLRANGKLCMDLETIQRVASLIARRNAIDAEIASSIGRPALIGHLGEWIAAEVFDIDLEASAVAKAIDGRFRSGPLAGHTVNIKWYGKREGLLDVNENPILDYYLVFTGPRGIAASSRGLTRPMVLDSVYLFAAHELLETLRMRRVKIGIATSVIASLWDAAELFPDQRNFTIPISHEQHAALRAFSSPPAS